MGNTIGGDDKPVLQCRTDSSMIPYRVWMADSAGRSETKKYGRPSRSLYQQTNHILLELSLKNK